MRGKVNPAAHLIFFKILCHIFYNCCECIDEGNSRKERRVNMFDSALIKMIKSEKQRSFQSDRSIYPAGLYYCQK